MNNNTCICCGEPIPEGGRSARSVKRRLSRMTLDEAIKHCLEVAEQNDTQAEKWQEEGGEEWGKTTACRECAADHRQLAEWLTELKEAKRLLKLAVEDYPDLTDMWRYADKVMKLIGGD